MSVILEFTLDADEFTLGQALSGPPTMEIELERIVPTGKAVLPLIWVTGPTEDLDTFETAVRNHPNVEAFRELDTVGDSRLYRFRWMNDPENLIEELADLDATILEAIGDDQWTFRVRFADHEKLTRFHNFCTDRGIRIHIERTYTLTEDTERGHRFDLSPEQREALVLALRRGYFATPREVELTALADELGISRQAVSDRIRPANEKVLQKALLSAGSQYE
ncbi:helix-turn-helix domain-containing protein [Haloarcula amylovorans]|uniref:helix-turn-helix domain-containing protein n=1 Tax=Haloarcula amylovorans TaxID=2562280 RepID=UPI001075ED83|nr:helix-turn-helix domain-containing protein [Halomicroarcula amylolytica]